MTFLALAGWQVALVAAVTAAAVIAIFFLKLRHPRSVVPSLLLWNRLLDERRHSSLLERLRRLLSLLIALAIALLLALAPARPEVGSGDGPPRRIALVLDTSPSMGARTRDGGTRWDRARAAARRLVLAGSPLDRFTIAGTGGAIAASADLDRRAALAAIERLAPGRTASSPLPRRPGWQVVFISDGVAPAALPDDAVTLSVFEAADNVAITAFEVGSPPARPLAFDGRLAVTNLSLGEKDVDVTVESVGARPRRASGAAGTYRTRMRLRPGQTRVETIDLSSFPSGALRATVAATGDALATDDVAFAYVPSRERIRTVLVTSGNPPLRTLLALDPRVGLSVVAPGRYADGLAADLFVFDRFAPPTLPARPALFFRPPRVVTVEAGAGRPRRIGPVRAPRLTMWNGSHPVLRAVAPDDLRIDEALPIEAPGAEVVAASGDNPLIAVVEHPVRRVYVAFDLQGSDFATQRGFPIFVQNVLAWVSGEGQALSRPIGRIGVPLENARVTALDATSVAARQVLGTTVFDAPAPGLFTASAGAERVRIAVGMTDAAASDLNRSIFADRAPAARGDAAPARDELWTYMLLASWVLLCLEWWTYHRRITV